MQPRLSARAKGGFTGWDVLICVVTVVLAAGVLLPAMARSKSRTKRIGCTSNLKQISLAFRMWANDHGEKFPMQVSMFSTNAGTMEFNLTGEVWRHFKALSIELNSPKVLACSSDTARKRVNTFEQLTNNKPLSYFVGLDADETKPQAILSGDRNLTGTIKPVKGVLLLSPNNQISWTSEIHNQKGNIALADGSAHQLITPTLNKQFQAALVSTTQAVHRLALPE